MSIETTYLYAGRILTVTADAYSYGTYYRLNDSDGGAAYSPVAIAASSSASVGPFATDRKYAIQSDSGALTFAITVDEDPEADETLTGATKINNVEGFVSNFSTIPADRTLATSANTQSIVYGTFTALGSFTIGGEIRFGSWPF